MPNLGLKNIMLGKSLPYDAEIEYLQFSGTQMIDTGVPSNTTNKITVDYHVVSQTPASGSSVSLSYIFGGGKGWGSGQCFRVQKVQSESHQAIYIWNGNNESAYVVYWGYRRTKLTYQNSTQYVCEPTSASPTTFTVSRATYESPIGTLGIGAFHRGNGTIITDSSTSVLRIYSFTANGYVDLVPVRKGNVGYMYDKISGQLFANMGTGSFILGPDKTN